MRVIFLSVFLILIISQVNGQKQWLYLSNAYQSGYINPAYVPSKNWQIALPDININSGIGGVRLEKFITKSPTSYQVNGDELINQIDEKASLYGAVDLNIIGLGKRIGNGYLSAGYGVKGAGNTTVKKDLVSLFTKGNQPFIGVEQNFELALQYHMMHQMYLGYAQQFGKLNLGIKVKYLNGISTLNTNKSNVTLLTNNNSYETVIKNKLDLHSSYPLSIDSNFKFETPTLNLSKNYGYGLDIGLEYRMNDNITLMLSATDIGKITWNDKVYKYKNEKNSILKGLNIQDLLDEKNVSIEDTIRSAFELLSEPTNNFTSQLNSTINIGGKYTLEDYTFGVVASNQFYTYGRHTNISVMALDQLTKYLGIGLSYTYRDKGHYLGLNASLDMGPVNFILSTQNALQPLGLKYLQSNQVMAGLSIQFGKIKVNDEEY